MKNTLSRTAYGALFFVLISSLCFSCSGADPVIYALDWTLQAVASPVVKNKISEQLILHILADDEDGFEELYEMYVIHDARELYWRVTSEEWGEFLVDNKTWIGVNALKREAGTPLPRGEYRVLLRDLSGYEDERKFTLSARKLRYTYAALPTMRFEKDVGYLPRFSGADSGESVGFLQLFHPQEGEVLSKEGEAEDVEYLRSLLGDNGVLYRVEHGKEIALTSEVTARFSAYLHYRKSDRLMLTTGPYDISIKK